MEGNKMPAAKKFVLWDWEDMYEYSRVVAGKIRSDKFRPDLIIAIARGGYVHARNLCDLLSVTDLTSIKVDHWGITASKDMQGARLRHPFTANLRGKNVLLVDDITDTGESFKTALPALKALEPAELKTATLFTLETSKFTPDYYAAKREWAWMIFPWNFTEDMTFILKELFDKDPAPKTTAEVAQKLAKNNGLHVPKPKLNDVLNELAARGEIAEAIDGHNRHAWFTAASKRGDIKNGVGKASAGRAKKVPIPGNRRKPR